MGDFVLLNGRSEGMSRKKKTQQTHNRQGFSNVILILMYFRRKTADYFRSNFSKPVVYWDSFRPFITAD